MRYLWYSMYAFVTALAIYSLFFAPARRHQPAPEPTPIAQEDPAPAVPAGDVQIALLLDTSSSMDGLIEQARTQLWEIVAELQTDDNDKERVVTVALYQYGNSRLDEKSGFVEKLSELTPELDGVSIKLHSLSTSGGKEYAPEAISRAVQELNWSDDDAIEKVIVIAGNEGFSQGPISAETAMNEAANRGIKVIPIFCANGAATSTGLASWKRAAQLASTELDTIDPDKVIAKVETPYDADIVKKYKELESTQLTYGNEAYRAEAAQIKTTASTYAQEKPMFLQADRAVAQSRQAGRADLVADYGANAEKIGSLKPASLPSELQGLSKDEQVREIKARKAKRDKIKSEIDLLAYKRKGYMQSAPAPTSPEPSLGSSVRQKLRSY
jgi:hypothetical protein